MEANLKPHIMEATSMITHGGGAGGRRGGGASSMAGADGRRPGRTPGPPRAAVAAVAERALRP